MTQGDLAKAVGKAYQQVSAWERGDKGLRAANLHAVAKALDVSPEWLQTGRGAGPESQYVLRGAAESPTGYQPDPPPLDLPRLAEAITHVEQAMGRSSRKATPEQKARLVAQIYLLLDAPPPPAGWPRRITELLDASFTIQ